MGFLITHPERIICRFIHLSKTEDEPETWINIDDITSVSEDEDALIINYISHGSRKLSGERAQEFKAKLNSISC
ncbi:MAG: hypothetical protein I4E98_09240 [Planktothrix agardhii KL2]|jgi:hypothetical protein|uniref:hypothetical protein n=1 Tax=Planktothrix agardhii TaxID=1160 RepID=UPI001A209319|nr:hypothetical protein [Planktothrix agardhii]MBG0746763.1 hypothetical protein [Planktothrix agardhii KL2]